MKKIISLFVLLLMISLMGCDFLGGNKLEKALNKTESVESATVGIEMTFGGEFLSGTVSVTMKYDENLYVIETPMGDMYYEETEGALYSYELVDGVYILSETPEEDSVSDATYLDFNVEDFVEDEDGVWVQVAEKIYLDDTETEYMTNVEIRINSDGYIASIVYSLMDDGSEVVVELIFSEYNATVVELPATE